ncbi:MAG: hypothetical protein IJJ20_03465 [Thermoguttaceae bacterium]|nr:hypothetical protein [Thermoguttaceae bacterium]
MTELPKKAILQPRVLDPGLTKGDWIFIILAVILVPVIAVAVTCLGLKPHEPPKTYEDCKSKEAQEEFLRNEIHQFLEKELNK